MTARALKANTSYVKASLKAVGVVPPRGRKERVAALREYIASFVPSSHLVTCDDCGEAHDERRVEEGCPFCESPLEEPLTFWDRLLTTAKGEPRQCAANVATVLRHHEGWRGVVGYDELRGAVAFRKPPPWGREEAPSSLSPHWTDEDGSRLASWCSRVVGLHVNASTAREGAVIVAGANAYHPVRDFLASLEWDGEACLDGWLVDFCGAEDNAVNRAVGAKFLISAVARAISPGCKVDYVLVLEGEQGKQKTSIARALATKDEWFLETPAEIASRQKDSYQVLAGKWVVELSELESVSRADVAKVKAYLTAQNDTYRASYGSRADVRDYPRHCVFIGTTNDDDYLKDATGNRRFWPVKLGGEVDLEGLRAAGEQLWAEAFARYSRGEAWHIEDRAILAGLEAAQEERFAADPWETALRLKLEDQDPVEIPYAEKGVSTDESLTLLGIDVAKRTKTDAMRVAAVLKRLGWERKQTRGKQNWKQREWRYFPSAGKVVDVTSPGGWEKRGGDVGGDAGKEAVVTTVTNVTNIIKGVRGKSVTPGGPGTANVTGDIGDAAPVIPLPGRRKRSEVAAR